MSLISCKSSTDYHSAPLKEDTGAIKKGTELNETANMKRKEKKFEKPATRLKTNLTTKPSLHIRYLISLFNPKFSIKLKTFFEKV